MRYHYVTVEKNHIVHSAKKINQIRVKEIVSKGFMMVSPSTWTKYGALKSLPKSDIGKMQKKPYRQVPLNDITFVLKMASFACFDDKMIVSNGIAGILILKGPIFRCYLAFFKRVCSSICQRDGWSVCQTITHALKSHQNWLVGKKCRNMYT